jgi:hypothetical protein
MKTDPASSKANSKSQEHHPKENDVIDLTVPNKHTSKKVNSKNGSKDLVDLCGPTDYVSVGDMAAMHKAARHGIEWDDWTASKSQKHKVENKVLANALVEQRRRTNELVERIQIEEQEREEKKRLDAMKGEPQLKIKKESRGNDSKSTMLEEGKAEEEECDEMIPIKMQEREEKKSLDAMKGKLQVKTKKEEEKAEEEEWDEMEVKPHVIVKTEKEFDDRETMRLAEEKAKKVVVKKAKQEKARAKGQMEGERMGFARKEEPKCFTVTKNEDTVLPNWTKEDEKRHLSRYEPPKRKRSPSPYEFPSSDESEFSDYMNCPPLWTSLPP